MDQSCLSGFWKRRRPSSGRSKRKVECKRSQLKENEAFPQEKSQQLRPPTTASTTREYILLDEKSSDTAHRGFMEGGFSSMIGARNKVSTGEDVDDNLVSRNTASRTHNTFFPHTPPSNETDQRSSHPHGRPNTSSKIEDRVLSHSKHSRWLRRCVSTTFRHPRRPSVAVQSSNDSLVHADYPKSPLPGIGMEPPLIPDNLMSGAAARAAAATGNEILESVRNLRLTEPKIPRDSESGIGIEIREREEESMEIPIPRKDPVDALPEELVEQILCYLDASSLIEAELVSRRWFTSASSHHVWKHIFREEFGYVNQGVALQPTQFQVGGPGLGKKLPNQDWKTMWRARKALHQRWREGHAAAIYLEGHTDSVYCVQFDEHKILTGSRDRTIRVWDAHTYECIEVLGVPSRNGAVAVAPLPTTVTGRGQRPFTKIISPQTSIEPTPSSSPLYHDGSILCLQYNDAIMITGSSDCTCIVWDLTNGYCPIRRLRHHTAGVLDVCFDSRYIVSCSKDTTICLWDQATGDFLQKLSGHRGPVNAVQLRGDLVVSASGDGVAKLWNLTSGLCIKEFPSKDRGMACVEFSPDSRTILAGGNDQVVYQFDTTTGELVRELNGHKGLVRSLHLDSANGRVVSGSYDTSVKAYDMATGQNIVDFMGWTTSWILSAKADYRRIVATSQDSRAVVMDFGYGLRGVELLESGEA